MAQARIGLVHLSDEHIGFADLCSANDSIEAPISHTRSFTHTHHRTHTTAHTATRTPDHLTSQHRCDSRIVLLYPMVDYVLRNHWHPKLKVYGDKVRWFPLGHGSGM
jgi:hypothetical protein